MKAANKVIAGEYLGKRVVGGGMSKVGIVIGFVKTLFLTSSTVESYECVTEEQRKSAASGAVRGLVGGAVLGGVGAAAGILSAKNKGIYRVSVQFTDGKRSLLEIDKTIYNALVKSCYK